MQHRRRHRLEAAILVFAWLLLGATHSWHAEAASVRLEHYVELSGDPGETSFTGSFLTGQDVQAAQDFRIDLSGIVSRYIGETERDLAALFSTASDTGVILFFDEADALFGRRTDVNDAHARFDDFVVLDEARHEWRGQLVLDGVADLPPGLYDLRGTFERITAVAHPASGVLMVAVAAALLVRHGWRRMHTGAPWSRRRARTRT